MSFNFGGTGGAGDKKPTSFGFGNTSTPAANPPANLFGAQSSTTPAGPPPAGQTFGFGTSGSGSLFGGAAKTENTPLFGAQGTNENKPNTSFSFGGATTNQAQSSNTPAAPSFSFGNTAATAGTSAQTSGTSTPGGFSFGGSKPAEPQQANQPAAGPSFGANTTSAPAQPAKSTPFAFGAPKADTTSTTTPAASGFSFGTAATPAAGGFSFGAAKASETASTTPAPGGSGFGAPKPADSLVKPAPPFSFGTPSANETETADTQAPKSGFSFGGSKPEEKKDGAFSFGNAKPEDKKDATPATSTTGGFSFGSTKPEEKKADSAAPSTGGFSFGAAAKADDKKDASTATPANGFSFGAAKPEEKKDANVAPTGGFSFGVSKAPEKKDAANPSALSSTSATLGAGVGTASVGPPPGILKNKTMEDIINKWSADLDKYSQEFQNQAQLISKWDQSLLTSGDQISRLYAATVEAEQSSGKIDQALSFIENQQDELSQLLESYESQVRDITSEAGINQPADQEREKAYSQADELITDLDSMGKNLSQMIDELNKSSEVMNRLKEDDPMTSIIKILNSQVQTLNWIDENTTKLNEKVEQVNTMQQTESSPRTPTGKFKFGALRLA